jgi:hypothetical protein
MKLHLVERKPPNMGSEDHRMMEEALVDLRDQNEALRYENKELRKFLEYINNQITNVVLKGKAL